MEIKDKEILKRLLNIPKLEIFANENLKNHLSFRPENSTCKYLLVCNTENALISTLRILKNKNTRLNYKNQAAIKHVILSNGTNTLFKDEFYNGFVVKLGKNFKKIKITSTKGNNVYVSVGASINLFALNHFLKQNGIGGMEWSYGIPGSVGGAIIMNAGAFGGEMSSVVEKVKIIKNGKFEWTKDFWFDYRDSSFKQKNDIVVEAVLKLKKSNQEDIEKLQKENLSKRLQSQPHDLPSAGSVFKRIIKQNEIVFPAKLIDNLGLKNVKIGGAMVSEKHAGFIVNFANATAKDFIELSEFVKNQVKEKYNLDLEQEVEIIEWGNMHLFGDYHTHTRYSSGKHNSRHAKGSIYENALIAKQKGLSEIGITEHGLSHKLYGLQKNKIQKIKKEIDACEKDLQIKILLGIEANIISSDGDIDMTDDEIKLFDYIVVGFHSFARAKSVKEYFKFFLPNILGFKRKKDIERNTRSLTLAMRKYPIKFISHPGVNMPLNFEGVCKVANETNTFLEINGKRIAYTKNDVKLIKKNKNKLIINSDAHTPNNVGEVNKPIKFILKNNIPLNLINNLIN